MAGSLKWFVYTTDAGDTFHVNMDESNAETVGNVAVGATPANNYALPSNIRARAVRYRSTDGLKNREIVCSTQAILDAAPTTATFADGNGGTDDYVRSSFRGEQFRRLPSGTDTGETDGDN